MLVSKIWRFSAAAVVATAVIIAPDAMPAVARAQIEEPVCASIAGYALLPDQGVAVQLGIMGSQPEQSKLIGGALRIYAGDRSYTVPIDHAVAVPTALRDHLLRPVAVQLDDNRLLEAITFETAPSSAGCKPAGLIVQTIVPRNTDDIAAAARDVARIKAHSPEHMTLACKQPFANPRTIGIVPLVRTDDAAQRHIGGTVDIQIDIDDTGVVRNAVVKSSSDKALNESSLNAARAGTYSPMIIACKGIPGTYIFTTVYHEQN
jgi:TonB family protein